MVLLIDEYSAPASSFPVDSDNWEQVSAFFRTLFTFFKHEKHIAKALIIGSVVPSLRSRVFQNNVCHYSLGNNPFQEWVQSPRGSRLVHTNHTNFRHCMMREEIFHEVASVYGVEGILKKRAIEMYNGYRLYKHASYTASLDTVYADYHFQQPTPYSLCNCGDGHAEYHHRGMGWR